MEAASSSEQQENRADIIELRREILPREVAVAAGYNKREASKPPFSIFAFHASYSG